MKFIKTMIADALIRLLRGVVGHATYPWGSCAVMYTTHMESEGWAITGPGVREHGRVDPAYNYRMPLVPDFSMADQFCEAMNDAFHHGREAAFVAIRRAAFNPRMVTIAGPVRRTLAVTFGGENLMTYWPRKVGVRIGCCESGAMVQFEAWTVEGPTFPRGGFMRGRADGYPLEAATVFARALTAAYETGRHEEVDRAAGTARDITDPHRKYKGGVCQEEEA